MVIKKLIFNVWAYAIGKMIQYDGSHAHVPINMIFSNLSNDQHGSHLEFCVARTSNLAPKNGDNIFWELDILNVKKKSVANNNLPTWTEFRIPTHAPGLTGSLYYLLI